MKPVQCSKCAHVYKRDFIFKRHLSIKSHRNGKEAHKLGELEVPTEPFFGILGEYKNNLVYKPQGKSDEVLKSTKDYLLRLIEVERKRIPYKWWLLTA